ncbi:hypothetical protein ACJX0J_015718, partial [Zea mays]
PHLAVSLYSSFHILLAVLLLTLKICGTFVVVLLLPNSVVCVLLTLKIWLILYFVKCFSYSSKCCIGLSESRMTENWEAHGYTTTANDIAAGLIIPETLNNDWFCIEHYYLLEINIVLGLMHPYHSIICFFNSPHTRCYHGKEYNFKSELEFTNF